MAFTGRFGPTRPPADVSTLTARSFRRSAQDRDEAVSSAARASYASVGATVDTQFPPAARRMSIDASRRSGHHRRMRVLTIVHQENCGPGVFSDVAAETGDELLAWRIADGEPPPAQRFDAVVALGGAQLPDATDGFILDEVELLRQSVADGVPVLGVCLGAEVLARALGADTSPIDTPEYGWHEIELEPAAAGDPVFADLPRDRVTALMAHYYGFDLPDGAVALARTPTSIHAFRYGDRAWGLQFHPEVTETTVVEWFRKRIENGDGGGSDFERDPPAAQILEQTPFQIGRWNEIGRSLFRRFLSLG
jgi:GMP synthase-like glutamine amidotransferase